MVKNLLLKEISIPNQLLFPSCFSELGVFGALWGEFLMLINENNLSYLDTQKV